MKIGERSAVIVTGACGGIGRALCHELHKSGYRVIAIDVRPKSSHLEIDKFLKINLNDVLESDEKKRRIKDMILEAIGGLPLKALINNAAVQIIKPFEELSEKDWYETLQTNLLVPFTLSQLFFRELAEGAGSILNISSIHANQTKRYFTAYATSKAALSSMTKLLAIELGDRIRVNAIEPGAIATEMLERGFIKTPEKRKLLDDLQPMKRIGTPEEVARLARFLISNEAEFMNGATVQIDGGIKSQLHDPS